MKFSKVIFHIKPIPSHPWWECKNTILFFILSSTKSVLRKSGVPDRLEDIKYFRAQVTQRAPRASEISDPRTYFPVLNVYHVVLKFKNVCILCSWIKINAQNPVKVVPVTKVNVEMSTALETSILKHIIFWNKKFE